VCEETRTHGSEGAPARQRAGATRLANRLPCRQTGVLTARPEHGDYSLDSTERPQLDTDGDVINENYEINVDKLATFERRASDAGLLSAEAESEYFPYLLMPNGDTERELEIGPLAVDACLDGNFESWTIIGRYQAVLDVSSSCIEAQIRPMSTANAILRVGRTQASARLSYIPGCEYLDDSGNWTKYDMRHMQRDQIRGKERLAFQARTKRILFGTTKSGHDVAISPATNRLAIFHSELGTKDSGIANLYSIKISSAAIDRHDEALDLLETVSGSIFFELDVLAGEPFELAQIAPIRIGKRPTLTISTPEARVPTKSYSRNALSLYFYARSARKMPLLEYLAYYQCIEHFFTQFTNTDLLRRLSSCLDDPRFSHDDLRSLTEIVSLVRRYGSVNMNELEQLRATVKSCIPLERMLDFIRRNDPRRNDLEDRRSILTGCHLKVDDSEVLDRVAERIYDIRCRIVHSKAEGTGRRGGDAILPFSKEARLLDSDIDLIQFAAQEVILSAGGDEL
jgi:hypothetical protein